MRLFETLKKPEVLPHPILKRLNIGVALVALELLTTLRDKVIENEESPNGLIESYHKNREMVECYNRLVQFLLGESLQQQEKSEPIIAEMIVEFKSLAFLSSLAGGYHDSAARDIKKFDADQAVALLEERLTLNAEEAYSMGDSAAELLNGVLSVRRSEVFKVNLAHAIHQ
jgi:hypothetical protein